MKTVPSILVLMLVIIGISSCSDKNSLHNYILDNAEKIGFSSSTIPISSIKGQGLELTEKQEEAFNAIERVNVLVYQVNQEKKEEFTAEKAKIKSILKQSKYEELVNLGSKGLIKFVGEEEAIDEIVIFVANKEMGFAVTRIVGDDMTMNKFMELYQMASQDNFSGVKLNLGGLTDLVAPISTK
ncbi:DUF4252 domain-containing protein [Kordia sp.]|uniref:DUF4252 domain-containing protein n=1 Tax=Kordia sp. TaxID=1965332 RepID=UPI003B5978CA